MDLGSWNATLNVKSDLVHDLLVLQGLVRLGVEVVRVVHAHATDPPIPLSLLVPAETYNDRTGNLASVSQLQALVHFRCLDALGRSHSTPPHAANRETVC